MTSVIHSFIHSLFVCLDRSIDHHMWRLATPKRKGHSYHNIWYKKKKNRRGIIPLLGDTNTLWNLSLSLSTACVSMIDVSCFVGFSRSLRSSFFFGCICVDGRVCFVIPRDPSSRQNAVGFYFCFVVVFGHENASFIIGERKKKMFCHLFLATTYYYLGIGQPPCLTESPTNNCSSRATVVAMLLFVVFFFGPTRTLRTGLEKTI